MSGTTVHLQSICEVQCERCTASLGINHLQITTSSCSARAERGAHPSHQGIHKASSMKMAGSSAAAQQAALPDMLMAGMSSMHDCMHHSKQRHQGPLSRQGCAQSGDTGEGQLLSNEAYMIPCSQLVVCSSSPASSSASSSIHLALR